MVLINMNACNVVKKWLRAEIIELRHKKREKGFGSFLGPTCSLGQKVVLQRRDALRMHMIITPWKELQFQLRENTALRLQFFWFLIILKIRGHSIQRNGGGGGYEYNLFQIRKSGTWLWWNLIWSQFQHHVAIIYIREKCMHDDLRGEG